MQYNHLHRLMAGSLSAYTGDLITVRTAVDIPTTYGNILKAGELYTALACGTNHELTSDMDNIICTLSFKEGLVHFNTTGLKTLVISILKSNQALLYKNSQHEYLTLYNVLMRNIPASGDLKNYRYKIWNPYYLGPPSEREHRAKVIQLLPGVANLN